MSNIKDRIKDPAWDWLKQRGWDIIPLNIKYGTARCNMAKKRIEMMPMHYSLAPARTLRYVVPHELAHAIHAELTGYECDKLRTNRKLTWAAAVEAVADRWCIEKENSVWMRAVVKKSCIWHSLKPERRYTWRDVMSPEAGEIVAYLKTAITNPQPSGPSETPGQSTTSHAPGS